MTNAGKLTIASNVVVLAALGAALRGLRFAMPFAYETHKILHILGAILLVGNVTVGPLWIILAWRSRDPKLLGWSARALALADIVFTVPGTQLLLWNGLAMTGTFGGLRAQAWLYQTAIMLVVTAVFAPTVVLYYQEKFIARAEEQAPRETVNAALFRWSLWGTVVMIPFGAALYTMVAKRGVW